MLNNGRRMNRKERERIDSARRILKALKKLYSRDYYILLRTNGTLGGIVYSIERRVVNGDVRTVYHLVTPNGEVVREYGDFMGEGMLEPVDARPILFHNTPIILTQRTVPGTDDDEENFTWIIVGEQAAYLERLKIANNKYVAEIREQKYIIDQLQTSLKIAEDKVSVLAEQNRMLEEKVSRLSEENLMLLEAIQNLRFKVNEYMIRGFVGEEALQNILRHLDTIGRRYGSVMDMVKEMYDKERELREARELAKALESGRSIGGEVYERLAEAERERDELKKRVEELERKLAEIERLKGVEKEKAVAAE